MQFKELPQNEQSILIQVYGQQLLGPNGYNPQRIKYVEELTEEEQRFFDKNNFASANQFVQKLYKISGNLIPLRFNLAVTNLLKSNDALRMNYCPVGTRSLKIFFVERSEKPEIVYRNLENSPDIDTTLKNIIEADMRQIFDLRHGHLIRFSVFHTGEEEYAVLVTFAKIIEHSVDVKNLFREVMNLKPVPSDTNPSKNLSQGMSEQIQNYWSTMLDQLPTRPLLPFAKLTSGLYKEKAYHTVVPADLMSDLRTKAKSNKLMLMTIFETAWAFLLQQFNNSNDVAFATLVPSKSDDDFAMIPARVTSDDKLSLQQIINQQFKQLLVSQPYASRQAIESQYGKFDHFLSFNDFLMDERLYSKVKAAPDGELVLKNSWNMQSAKLALYFHYTSNAASFSILYDKNSFQNDFGALLSKRFLFVIQQMLTDWNAPYSQFISRLTSRLQEDHSEPIDDIAFSQNFISQLELFHGLDEGYLQPILNLSKLETYFEGDRISGSKINENLIFVAEGKVVRNIETNDGWFNTLDIIKANGFINEIVLLPNHKTNLSVEVLSEKAILMSIPLEDFELILKGFSYLSLKLLRHALAQMEKYQRLWIQS